MKRDMELIRAMLLQIEAHENPTVRIRIEVEGYSAQEIVYHVKLLAEAGLIEAYDASSTRELYWIPKHLTWSGHEFLDAVRHEVVWSRTKEIVEDKGGAVPFEIWQSLALSIARSLLGIG